MNIPGFDRRILIFAGHYGSGKSEIAVNVALRLREEGRRVTLVDLDIVNPFFRSVDARAQLEREGVTVHAPLYANTNVDVPALLPAIASAMHDRETILIVDVGGDDDGARVLGSFHRDLVPEETLLTAVVNASRPMTRTAEETAAWVTAISAAARLPVSHILSNTHFMGETEPADILAGLDIARDAAVQSGCTVSAVAVMAPLTLDERQTGGVAVLPLEKTMRTA